MNKYSKPIVLNSNEIAEGVFAGSGVGDVTGQSSTSCYSVEAHIVQSPQEGSEGTYVIQVNAQHASDHTRDAQVFTISFNQPVTLEEFANGALTDGNGTSTLVFSMWYHQNPNDNIGFGGLKVHAGPGLAITSISITD